MKKEHLLFSRLVNLMDTLRSPGGCPWDRKQNHRSLRICLIEETCEVLDAIERKNPLKLKEELGDLLYQVIFHARIAKEKGHFSINDVLECIYNKLVERHPHVFGKEKIKGANKVIEAWQRRKLRGSQDSVFANLPPMLPALHKTLKVQNNLSLLGCRQGSLTDTLEKVRKGVKELKDKIIKKEKYSLLKRELGELLFNIVNLARLLNIEPEMVLNETTNRYIRKYKR
ncbi:MAG: nucleoside triphosphate pyrophosphohydrolase [Candidatus Omnitrophota bacterium]